MMKSLDKSALTASIKRVSTVSMATKRPTTSATQRVTFCEECGQKFADEEVNFCEECGVKRGILQ